MAVANPYSRLDRVLHRIAFSSPKVQLTASELEDSLFSKDLADVDVGPPIFITSLPRAGTTIILEALNAAPELAAHLYRDMPFVMAPMLWSSLTRGFQKTSTLQERAHGDGIAIGFDSPEAFEEVIWHAFWPEHYDDAGITPWTAANAKTDALEFMTAHFRKIVALRCKDAKGPGRYISKNNTNIARLELIPRMFPDAVIVTPVRSPLSHAISLHRQHANFLKRHAEDSFARRYMSDIGHFEFGALHRPIRFERLQELTAGKEPDDLDYWLAYWIAAFEHVAGHRDRVHLIGYENLCNGGEAAAAGLCETVGLDPSLAPEIGAYFRPVPPLKDAQRSYRSAMRERAEALHRQLLPEYVDEGIS